MLSISLGPLALPTAPLLLLVCTLLASWLADRWPATTGASSAAAHPPPPAGSLLTQSVGVALLAARLAHVAWHRDAYLAEPWAVIDLRDGGWNVTAGLAAGLAWLAGQAWRHPLLCRALGAGAALGLTLWSAGTFGLAATAPRGLPDVALTDPATGQRVSLREVAANRPAVVNLWATWCGPCRREMPVLADAQVLHPEVLFVFANQGESADAIHRYLASEGLAPIGVLMDTESRLGPALGSSGLPTTVFFDRSGRRVDAHLGALNAAALAGKLAAISAP
jgi:thiol-disulfide isomerase/thioredoxin